MTPEQYAHNKITEYVEQQVLEYTEMAEMHKAAKNKCLAEKNKSGADIYEQEHLQDLALATKWKLILECLQ